MKGITLSAVLCAFVASTLAADCTGNSGSPTTDPYWELRENMCGTPPVFGCKYQENCILQTQETYQTFKFVVQLKRTNYDGVKGFADCWDATEDMINQCIGSGWTDGATWKWNGQSYEFKAWYLDP
ncbi:hypothetical protein PCL_02210 [Purpureocillium lilacinum]|uniref:Uncharacterized protein n=1 Tax=Purpureocillium lilacinum TaxID=33203 RepID=A0A2U3E1Q1_PURLI|nr:hypothetical protein Purlil1_4608 [Purpureocillium lilacinum]PWI68441.1 hypothetical protein PCL_02210 [Purpureocillium lilacinum]